MFDSGELGKAGPPTAGRLTWDTPVGPARRHLHLLLPDPPVHAGRVPGRRVARPSMAGRARTFVLAAPRRRARRRRRAVVVLPPRRRARGGEARADATARSAAGRPRPTARGRCGRARSRSGFVGYRIEELFGGETIKKTAVGRTPDVTGSMTVDGSTISDVHDHRGHHHAGQRPHRPRHEDDHRRARDRRLPGGDASRMTDAATLPGRAGQGQRREGHRRRRPRAARRDQAGRGAGRGLLDRRHHPGVGLGADRRSPTTASTRSRRRSSRSTTTARSSSS